MEPTFEEACEACGHLQQGWAGLVTACVISVEVSSFQRVVDLVFVFFGDVEYKGAEACVAVGAVLFPDGCASDGDYDACACFADFYGGSVNGGDYCFLVVGLEGNGCAVEL